MKSNKSKATIFGPIPPPVGGIGSIVTTLNKAFFNRSEVNFVFPLSRNINSKKSIFRSIINIIKLIKAIQMTQRGGKILIFSSEGNSFYEKLIWSLFIILFGRQVAVLMVSGVFPLFWSGLSIRSCKIISIIVNNRNFTLIAQSDSWMKFYKSIFPNACIEVAGATVSDEFLESLKVIRKKNNFHSIIYVGWISLDKGLIDLFDAVKILSDEFLEFELRLIGPFMGNKQSWENEVNIRGISGKVKFIGSLSDEKLLIEEFNNASIFVFPSHFEGLPLALLEAISFGLACVGTNVGGIPDLLDNGNSGILIPPKNPLEIAGALRTLFMNSDFNKILSERAREHFKLNYSKDNFIISYEKILRLT